MTEDRPVVLVVEDERDLATLYAEWLSDGYEVRTAFDGTEALETVDESVDVVLLDRRMPDLSGDEVLEEIRERDLPCRVSMVTAVEPDFDIIEMGFDSYLVKPITRSALTDTVERLLACTDYDEKVRESFSLAAKKAVLEAQKSDAELEANEEYQELETRLSELRDGIDETFEQFETDDFDAAFRDLGTDGVTGSLDPSD